MLAAALAEASQQSAVGGDVLSSLTKLSTLAPQVDGLQAPDTSAISPNLAWLPFSLDEALAQLGLTRIVNERLRVGYYRDRLIVLTTQEKSASTLHDVALLKMLEHTALQATINPMPRALHGGPLAMAGHAAFHFGLLLHHADGGVVRGEFKADPQNIWMIQRTLGLRTVVLTRHPADRLVALYCMRHDGLRARMKNHGVADLSEESVLSNLFAASTKTLPANIGSLRHNLEWLESWLCPEPMERAVIARYEDMMTDAVKHFENIHAKLFGKDMSPELQNAVAAVLAKSGQGGALQSGDSATRSYPKGYSGRVNVWLDYLTQNNVDVYNNVVKRFLEYTPVADKILEVYPDLMLDRSLAATGRPAVVVKRPLVDLSAVSEQMRTTETEPGQNQVPHAVTKLDRLFSADPLEAGEPPVIFRRIEWLPHTIKEGAKFVALSRIASKRLKEGYYRDRLVILASQEKSGSTMHAVAIRQMLRWTGRVAVLSPLPRQKTSSPTTMAGGTVFHAGMLLHAPNGGICRGVFEPTSDNKLHMSETGARQIVLTRHPADRVVAQYCMHLSSTNKNIESSLAKVIDLHLANNLNWLAGWASDKNDRRLLVRFEDMLRDRHAHFARIHDFLYQKPMSDVLVSDIEETFNRSGEGGSIRSGNLQTRVYERGYSGKIGVWRDYMTPANVSLFNAVVERYLSSYPHAGVLLDVYPDLRLNAAELSAPSAKAQDEAGATLLDTDAELAAQEP